MGEVTLYDMLEFREKKAEIQSRMLRETAEGFVVSLGMNIPGPVKKSPDIFWAFEEGRKEVRRLIQNHGIIQEEIILDEPGGYAVIFRIAEASPIEIKKFAVSLEETHLLGRLFDVDVLDQSGQALTRQMIGAKGRKCLLCDCDAKVCGRNRTHSVEELQKKVFDILRKGKAYGISKCD